jgi:hypothetical protein
MKGLDNHLPIPSKHPKPVSDQMTNQVMSPDQSKKLFLINQQSSVD